MSFATFWIEVTASSFCVRRSLSIVDIVEIDVLVLEVGVLQGRGDVSAVLWIFPIGNLARYAISIISRVFWIPEGAAICLKARDMEPDRILSEMSSRSTY